MHHLRGGVISIVGCRSQLFSLWGFSESDILKLISLSFRLFQGLKEFVNEVNTLASLQHSSLCKLIGFHAREGSEHRMLVFERLFHGSLDRLLFGRSDGPPIDWNARTKIALCAAQGLTFLHEEGPFQVSTLSSVICSLSCVAIFPHNANF